MFKDRLPEHGPVDAVYETPCGNCYHVKGDKRMIVQCVAQRKGAVLVPGDWPGATFERATVRAMLQAPHRRLPTRAACALLESRAKL